MLCYTVICNVRVLINTLTLGHDIKIRQLLNIKQNIITLFLDENENWFI